MIQAVSVDEAPLRSATPQRSPGVGISPTGYVTKFDSHDPREERVIQALPLYTMHLKYSVYLGTPMTFDILVSLESRSPFGGFRPCSNVPIRQEVLLCASMVRRIGARRNRSDNSAGPSREVVFTSGFAACESGGLRNDLDWLT